MSEMHESSCTAVVHVPRTAPTESQALALLDDIHAKLDTIKNIDEVKERLNQVGAIHEYLKRSKKSLEVQNHCAFVKAMAERQIGRLLIDTGIGKGRPEKMSPKVTISALGISPRQSVQWQNYAKIDEDSFREWLAHCNKEGKELTSAYLTRALTSVLGKEAAREMAEPWAAENMDHHRHDVMDAYRRVFSYVAAVTQKLQGREDLWKDMTEILYDDEHVLHSSEICPLVQQFQYCRHQVGHCIDALERRIKGEVEKPAAKRAEETTVPAMSGKVSKSYKSPVTWYVDCAKGLIEATEALLSDADSSSIPESLRGKEPYTLSDKERTTLLAITGKAADAVANLHRFVDSYLTRDAIARISHATAKLAPEDLADAHKEWERLEDMGFRIRPDVQATAIYAQGKHGPHVVGHKLAPPPISELESPNDGGMVIARQAPRAAT